MTWNGVLALLGKASLKQARPSLLCSRLPIFFVFNVFVPPRENRAIECTHGLNSSNHIDDLTLADEIINGGNPADPLLFRPSGPWFLYLHSSMINSESSFSLNVLS